jgi:hypothetical protein
VIVFDLGCGGGHVFEAWFGSSGDFEAQRERGLIACPLCGDTRIAKAVMAPAVAAKGNRRDDAGALLRAQRALEAGSDYVGRDFAARARALHDDPAEARPIHGEATPDEAAALRADGIPVMPLPFRPLARADA